MKKIVFESNPPTAIFPSTDVIAIGVLDTANIYLLLDLTIFTFQGL